MNDKQRLLTEIEKLHRRFLLSENVAPDYFEPGMMEYLEQYEGVYDAQNETIMLRFESKGTRYDGRTERIEQVKIGDAISVVRDRNNKFNSNNFVLLTENGYDVGFVPAELCNAIAPMYDRGELDFREAHVSFVEPISKRSRYAKQAVLFVELHIALLI